MDPSVIIACIVAAQVVWQAWIKYKTDKPKAISDSSTALAGVVDGRIKLILEANEAELLRLREIEKELLTVLAYIKAAGIDWPPGEE